MSGEAYARLGELLDETLLKLRLYQEMEHYSLPEELRPEGILRHLVDSAVALLEGDRPEDDLLQRLVIDLYDARHKTGHETEYEIGRVRQALLKRSSYPIGVATRYG